jgi:hypothetical protein
MEGHIKNRSLAIFVVVALILSTLMVINTTMAETYEAMQTYNQIPGVNMWEGCSRKNVGAGAPINTSVLNTSTQNLYYDNTVNINVNGSLIWATTYYLYFPVYSGTDGTSYNLTWRRWYPDIGPSPTIDSTDRTFENVHLNHSGLWIIDDATSNHSGKNWNTMNETIPAWFWVNASDDLAITLSESSVEYGEKKTITVTVKKAGEGYPCSVDVRAFYDNKTVFSAGNAWTSTGSFSFRADTTNFTAVDTYRVYAYRDVDSSVVYYKESPKYYPTNGTYGNNSITADYYSFANCGAWDPPEYNQSATKSITVKKAKPIITLTNSSDVYWGFDVRLDVNVTDQYGKGLNGGVTCIKVRNREGTYLSNTYDPTNLTISAVPGEPGNYSIEFARGSANWTQLYTQYANGTWRVYYIEDVAGDTTEEWNNSASFSVKSKAPAARIKILDDGDGDDNMKVDVPAWDGTWSNGYIENGTIDIVFTIFGSTVDGVKAYYGDNAGEDKENITVSGDILYPAILNFDSGTNSWTATCTPTKNGGKIEIEIDWEKNGTDKETISIINGTTVMPSIDSFTVDENTTITVTVKSLTGSLFEWANVTLFWGDWDTSILDGGNVGDIINSTNGDGTAGNGLNGEYTFIVNKSEQRDIAPQNITIVAKLTAGIPYYGYAQVLMDRNHDLMVNCTPTVSYAGVSTEYDIYITTLSGDKPEEDSTLYIKLYNETGKEVTNIDQWSEQATATIEDETIPLSGGTFYLFAYNDTHDSEGQNATIVVTPYMVESDPSVLAWLIDTSTNITFSVTPPVNGTLTLENMSGAPNGSAVADSYDIEINNGVGTLEEVNATNLGNITYDFTPEDGSKRPADGLLRITTATATPVPATVYINEPTNVVITCTHPATDEPIKDVRVGLDHGINLSQSLLNKLPDDEFTDEEGKVYFSIITGGSGNITIYMENQSDPDNKFVIRSTAKREMRIYSDASVNEGGTFTVTAKLGDTLITDTIVTFTFAGESKTTSTGTVEFTVPSVPDSLDYRIDATAEGYTSASTTIKVINIPQLGIVISTTADITTNSQFDVTIADDQGSAIIGATITINGVTYTSGAGGRVTITAPASAGTYEITVTKPGFADADPQSITVTAGGVPGFELLTLIAAIGIAFILIRRRRQ